MDISVLGNSSGLVGDVQEEAQMKAIIGNMLLVLLT